MIILHKIEMIFFSNYGVSIRLILYRILNIFFIFFNYLISNLY